MIYDYHCNECDTHTEVIKSVRFIDQKEKCQICDTLMTRAFAPTKIHLSGTAVQEKKWQPALGRAATDNEMRQEAKRRGMIEVGNERPENHLKPPEAEYPSFSDHDIESLTRKP